ncbi:MAG: hypothetical protein LBJ72_12995 [Dysgonamonadaceae bacterium]|jgi:hypothetical protein|nr:hypothetical protein [Dysgonamonadaceae bacterium]
MKIKRQSVIEQYLAKHHKQCLTTNRPVPNDLEMVVVIPCFNEPEVLTTLNSLLDCHPVDCGIEIIVLINSYTFVDETIKGFNKKTYQKCLDFALNQNRPGFEIIPLLIEDLPGHQTGAGLPRKIGMDEATFRFNRIASENGIIICLDADCTVERNYLSEIHKQFRGNDLNSATIEFHHPVGHLPENDPIRRASEAYESYLRYYRAALEYCGFPYAYYTIGSAIAVTCETYARVGGMCKLQAGEDFYFMQKVFPLEKTKFIDSTKVYPAARFSDRVPFGTGPELAKLSKSDSIIKYTYNFGAFQILKQLFDQIDSFFKSPPEDISFIINDLPQPVRDFIIRDNLICKLEEINRNTGNISSFRKRFFSYFNAFKILKYLNYAHETFFQMENATISQHSLDYQLG